MFYKMANENLSYEFLHDVKFMDPELTKSSGLELIAGIPLALVGFSIMIAGAVSLATVYGINEIIQQSKKLAYSSLGKKLERVDDEESIFPKYKILE